MYCSEMGNCLTKKDVPPQNFSDLAKDAQATSNEVTTQSAPKGNSYTPQPSMPLPRQKSTPGIFID